MLGKVGKKKTLPSLRLKLWALHFLPSPNHLATVILAAWLKSFFFIYISTFLLFYFHPL